MKKILNAWYELTVIPAIVLACVTYLGWSVIHLMETGVAYATPSEGIFAFFMFLFVMTVENVYDAVTPTLCRVWGVIPPTV